MHRPKPESKLPSRTRAPGPARPGEGAPERGPSQDFAPGVAVASDEREKINHGVGDRLFASLDSPELQEEVYLPQADDDVEAGEDETSNGYVSMFKWPLWCCVHLC